MLPIGSRHEGRPMVRWSAAGLWGGVSAVLIVLKVAGQTNGGGASNFLADLGQVAFVGTGLALAVLIGVGGRRGLTGAVVGAGLAGLLTFVLFGLRSNLQGWGEPLPIVISATLALTSGLAAREMWKARIHSHS